MHSSRDCINRFVLYTVEIFRRLLKYRLLLLLSLLCTNQCYPGGRGRTGRGGDFEILSKIFVKNHSPGTTYFFKTTKLPHPRAGELRQMFLPRGNAIHFRHPPRPNQTKKLYVYVAKYQRKTTKNRNHSSNQLHEIK